MNIKELKVIILKSNDLSSDEKSFILSILEQRTHFAEVQINFISEEQAMEILRVKRTYLYNLRKLNKLEWKRVGRNILISMNSIKSYLNS